MISHGKGKLCSGAQAGCTGCTVEHVKKKKKNPGQDRKEGKETEPPPSSMVVATHPHTSG